MSDLLVYVPLVAALVAVVGLVLQWQRNRTLRDRLGEVSDELRDVKAQLAEQAPRPEVAIHALGPVGGDAGNVLFAAGVVNRGLKPTHATIEASVAGEVIYTRQGVNLLANDRHVPVNLEVPRPRLGDLVLALGDATTLYGETLTVTVTTIDGDTVTETWIDEPYDPETDRARYEAQQRAWRIGRGEDTEADRRAEYLDDRIRRMTDR